MAEVTEMQHKLANHIQTAMACHSLTMKDLDVAVAEVERMFRENAQFVIAADHIRPLDGPV